MKTLSPYVPSASLHIPVEAEINKVFQELYRPIFELMSSMGLDLKNSAEGLKDAVSQGRIYYDGHGFKGSFSSSISKELKSIGATYDRKEKTWKIPQSQLPDYVRSALVVADGKFKRLQESILRVDMSLNLEGKTLGIDRVVTEANAQLTKQLGVQAVMGSQTMEVIKTEWRENLALYITDFSAKNIVKLRTGIQDKIIGGLRAESLLKEIQDNFNLTKTKARFLARQETNLLTAKLKKERYREAGINRYIWVTAGDSLVRESHRQMEGKICDFDNPPMVDGQPLNPREDYNCRCNARPIID